VINGATTSVSNFGGGTGTAWYLLDTSRPVKPLIYQLRRAYNLVRLDRDTDSNVFMRDELLYGVDGRSNVGFGFWQMAYASKAELNADNYGAARAAMQSLTNEAGTSLAIMPNLLVVPPSLEGAGRKLLKNEFNAAAPPTNGSAPPSCCPCRTWPRRRLKIIRITAKKDGFRRAGMVHPTTATDYPAKEITAEQLKILMAEPLLVVQELELPDDPKGAGGKPGGK
jgi:hypothetical protein